jgi:putative membrane protein
VGFLIRVVANAAAIFIAASIVPGIRVADGTTVLIAGFVLGVINALVKPLLTIVTLPLTLVTLGLFLFVLNAACFGLAAYFVPGFSVAGFWPALVASLIVSIVSWLLTALMTRTDTRS